MGDLSHWFNNIPIITRCWFGGTVALSLLGRFGLLNPYYLMLNYELLIKKFQIWRLFTAIFYYPITPGTGFHFLINLYFLYNYSSRLETGQFAGRTADYLFAGIFIWICTAVAALLGSLYVLMDPLVMAVLYIWCQLNKDVIVSFWFGSQFKAIYLPWVLMGFNMVMAGGGMTELLGILVGHLYFFLAFKYPQEFGGPSLLQTPPILYQYFPVQRGFVGGFGQAPQYRQTADAAPRGGVFRGQGHTLRD